jgi:S-formylglutathione hydrolase
MTLTEIENWKSFGGRMKVFDHDSDACSCRMRFGIYLPPQAENGPVPALTWLSGLTCSWANVMEKSGLQRVAAELGFAVIGPDTSPRGEEVADDEASDMGQGAGFYLTATQAPWAKHYRMDQYVAGELFSLVHDAFPLDRSRHGVFGHSMGGHGALTLHLKHPQQYRSVSALAPICAPSQVPWGRKAFTAYLGEDESAWADYDATRLVAAQPSGAPILIDTGSDDISLEAQLRPDLFEAACAEAGQPLHARLQPGYDHSYWFVSSFMEEHLRWHAGQLGL